MIKNIFLILSLKERVIFFYILILNLLATFIELLGVGLIFPVILSLINSYEELNKIQYFRYFIEFFNIRNRQELIYFIIFFVIFFFIIKTIFLFFKSYFDGKFIFNLKASISEKLFSKYLLQPYKNFIENSSSHYIQNTINVTNQFIETTVMPLIILIPEILIIFSLFICLLIITPEASLFTIFIIAVPSIIFFQLCKIKIKNWGLQSQLHEKKMMLELTQGLGSAKDIKLYGKENYFINRYKIEAFQSANFIRKAHVLRQLSRYFLELVAVIGLLAFLSLIINKKNIIDIIPILGIFFASTIRMLPSANRILLALQVLKYGNTYIKILKKEFYNLHNILSSYKLSNNDNSYFPFEKNIEFKNISFGYSKNKLVLKNINLKIKKNSIIGLIGKTGSGKSTFINLLVGLIKPNKGNILVDGKKIFNFYKWMKSISYVSQSIVLLDDTIANNITFGERPNNINQAKIRWSCEQSNLKKFISSLPMGLKTRVGEKGAALSGGQIQRLGIARALYKKAEILILDESTSSLDFLTEKSIIRSLNKLSKNKTVIIISHRPSILELCDKILEIKNLSIREVKI
jgi:ABC-type multidrug transport system fused ATPase/permease subunit